MFHERSILCSKPVSENIAGYVEAADAICYIVDCICICVLTVVSSKVFVKHNEDDWFRNGIQPNRNEVVMCFHGYPSFDELKKKSQAT